MKIYEIENGKLIIIAKRGPTNIHETIFRRTYTRIFAINTINIHYYYLLYQKSQHKFYSHEFKSCLAQNGKQNKLLYGSIHIYIYNIRVLTK